MKPFISSWTLGLRNEWILIVVWSSLSCLRGDDGTLLSHALAGQLDRWPVFIELVDKHYYLTMNIVERLVALHLSAIEPSRGALFVKNTMADYIALHAPDDLCPLYAKACQTQNRPDCRKVFQRLIWWSHRSQRDRGIADGIERSTRASLKLFEKLHPYEAVRNVLPTPIEPNETAGLAATQHLFVHDDIRADQRHFGGLKLLSALGWDHTVLSTSLQNCHRS